MPSIGPTEPLDHTLATDHDDEAPSGLSRRQALARGGTASAALLTPGLFAAALVTPGVPGLLIILTLLGVTLAGVVCEGTLFLTTFLRFGRRLSVLDLHRDDTERRSQPFATDGG